MAEPGGRRNAEERVLRSPALYLGELRLPADRGPTLRRLLGGSGRSLKNLLLPSLHRFVRHAPTELAMLPFDAVAAAAQPLYALRGNALRQACEHLATVAQARGAAMEPREVYRRYFRNFRQIIEAYMQLERRGVEAALERVDLAESDADRIRSLLSRHEGAILAVPHNSGAVYCAARLQSAFPLLIIARNSTTAERTRLALEVFERMGVKVIMVRGGNPVGLARPMYRGLRERRLLIATVDNLQDGPHTAKVTMFGREVSLSPWAADIAARRRVPVIPGWFSIADGRVRCNFGEPLLCDDPAVLVRHYMGYFERCILEDPANWAYLGARRWQRVLADAAATGAAPARPGPAGPQPRT